MNSKKDFFDRLQGVTERYLSARRRERIIKKEKQKAKNPVFDWLGAFLWAAGVVLLINQYLFQAYRIPSGSMIDTLLIGDHIFVNKIIYGPEILPGLGKLPSPVKPKRNDIIIFENPKYISRGTAFDIAQRIIYMLTLSFVDIDLDENGQPKAHFLIKRAVGMGGDRFVSDRGNMKIRFAGDTQWTAEADYLERRNWTHNVSRLMRADLYPALEAAGKAAAFRDLGLPVPPALAGEASGLGSAEYADAFHYRKIRLELLRTAYPHDTRYRTFLAREHTLGWYVPENRILPLGDNRDNSKDGRSFGPVKTEKILGRGSLIYFSWPRLQRIGLIR
ncbi:MAG: signal peptidase I [Treponema sp.]|jgi:signal peptidase I|nr:signal peptidase I [Treponema sp.]